MLMFFQFKETGIGKSSSLPTVLFPVSLFEENPVNSEPFADVDRQI